MKQKLLLIAAAALLVAAFSFGIVFIRQNLDEKASAESFEHASEMIEQNFEHEENPAQTLSTPTSFEVYSPILEENSDFVGWISIEGTKIDYPVMQTPDNPNFYLKHAFDKTYSDYGVPYVQEDCDLETSDSIVIYGHNMNNGTMFADLCKYEDEAFYKEHRTIRFDTLFDFGEYEIVYVFKTVAYSDDGFKYYQFVDFENEEDFNKYISKCGELALYDTGVTAEYGDKLVTVSTCEYSQTDGRIVVVARKIV